MVLLPEQRFEQHVTDRGLATEEELKAARKLAAQVRAAGQALSLPEALIRTGAMTKNQARRVLAALKEETISGRINIPGVQLSERIGRGSQAVVYKGRQVSIDRPVAVKILVSESARDPLARERFLQEARAAAKLSHNNIVQAIDAGEAEGFVFFIMELIDPPQTVADAIHDAGGPMEEADALRIVIQIAEALAHAHSRGFIHRDVKPKNIMLTADGVPKLADMGLVRQASDAAIEEAGKAFGTPFYIAPEQVRGDPNVDFRADIYSLGATFYEMLTGRTPFAGATAQQIMQKHVTTPLTPPDHINAALSAGVSEVVEVMMSKRAKDRYNSTEDLLLDLRAVAEGRPPPIASDRIGLGRNVMEGLAEGEKVRPRAEDAATHSAAEALAITPLVIILLVVLAVSVILNIIQALL